MSTFAAWRRKVAAEQEPKSKVEGIVALVWLGVSTIGLILLIVGFIVQSSAVATTGFAFWFGSRFVYWVAGFFTPKWYPPFATPDERKAIKRRRRLKAVRGYARTGIFAFGLTALIVLLVASFGPSPAYPTMWGAAAALALLAVGAFLLARRLTSALAG